MKTLINKLIILLVFISGSGLAQYVWGPEQTTYRRDLRRTGSNNVISDGLKLLNHQIEVGKAGSTWKRVVYQWNIPDNIIPDNSTITKVTLYFTYSKLGHSYELQPGFHSISLDVVSPNQNQLNQMWNEMNISIGSTEGVNGVINFTSTDSNNPFNIAVRNSLINNRFVLGIRWPEVAYVDYRTWGINNSSVTLKIEYEPPVQNVTIDQKLSNNSSVDSVGQWNSSQNKFDKFLAPQTFNWEVNSTQTLQGSQKILSDQKYLHWENNSQVDNDIANHKSFQVYSFTNNLTSRFKPTHPGVTIKNALEGTSVTGGTLAFRDPWFIDYTDGSFGGQKRNRGMTNAEFKSRTSPFYPDYNTVYDGGNEYQGIFLNQEIAANKPYYKLWAGNQLINLGSPIDVRQFFFQNWSATGATLQTFGNDANVVFTSGNAIVQANLKGQGLSNNTDAYTNHQRKAVRLENNNHLMSVYKSLNKIWLEQSNDNGATWFLKNGGTPLDNDDQYNELSTPSIDYIPAIGGAHPFAAVLHNALKLSIVRENTSIPYHTESIIVNFDPVVNYITPVIAVTSNRILIICNNGMNQTGQIGLAYLYGTLSFNGTSTFTITWKEGDIPDSKIIPNTYATSINPTVVSDKNNGDIFHIAWEENNMIKYCKATGNGNSLSFTTSEIASQNSPYNQNKYPSISLANGNPVISWTGIWADVQDKMLSKVNTENPPKTVVRRKGTTWSDFQIAGNNVNYTNNNSVTSSAEKTVIVWSEGNPPVSKWMKRTNSTYSTPSTLSHSGIQTQVINGSDYNVMTSVVFNTNQTPYYFTKTTTSFADKQQKMMSKITDPEDTVVTFGRAGLININDVGFVFNTGDIIVEDSVISFLEKPDTLVYLTYNDLNQYTKSDIFSLNSSSDFFFSNMYYVINKEFAETALTENDNVNFKVELVKASNNTIAGVFDNINFNKNNLDKYANVYYQVDCSNIQAGEYYLRLVTTVNGNSKYSLANIMNESSELEKKHFMQVNFTGTELPISYDLLQNFPNPFNPSTTIKYQLPEDGNITLRIYDILGKEIKTLVDEQKPAGKYEINFDASDLASGVYIYRIQVNPSTGSGQSFVSAKKMMFVK